MVMEYKYSIVCSTDKRIFGTFKRNYFIQGILCGHTRTLPALLNVESLRKLIFRLKPLCDTALCRLKRRHRSPLGELCVVKGKKDYGS